MDSPSRKKIQPVETHVAEEVPVKGPNWLDQSFPWSMRVAERSETALKEEEEKLKWIERYLERESDEDEEEDQSLHLPDLPDEEDKAVTAALAPKRGRGKMVPLPVNPAESRKPTVKRHSRYFPSDPADARAALLSKRSVRALSFRRKQEREEVVCICNGRDDGRDLVQCDDCKTWFHLECIGINDVSELGSEDDPWYCTNCLGVPPPRTSSPTFVPTDNRPASSRPNDPLFFQGAGQESPPGIPWNTPRAPKTPVRGSRTTAPQLSSRSSWDDSSSQVGPETPSTGTRPRVYETPPVFKPLEEPFDPMSTPSRGMRFSGPFATPKPMVWPSRHGPVQTPSKPSRKQAAPWSYDSRDDSSPYRPVYDESPVRHSQPRPDRNPRRVQESPLASRSTSFPHIGRPGSPLSMRPNPDRIHHRMMLD